MMILLQNYQSRYKLKSIKQLIARYAPRQDNNNTDAYARVLSNAVGVSQTETISMLDYKTAFAVAVAIIQHENGVQCPYPDTVIQQGLVMAGIKTPDEKAEQRPLGKSREFTRGGIVVGGSTIAAGIGATKEYMQDDPLPETTMVDTINNGVVESIEVIKPQLPDSVTGLVDSLSGPDIVQLVLLAVIALAAIDWMLDRRLTANLGLR